MSKPSQKCVSLIEEFEGFRLEPYLDSVGIATIGFGSTYYLDEKTKVTLEDEKITKEFAEQLLLAHLSKLALSLEHMIEIDLNQNQIDALLDLVYNIGLGNFKSSTLLKLLNSGDLEKASSQFLVWNKAGGKVVDGLTRRREADRNLFIA